MSAFTEEEKRALLKLARSVIISELKKDPALIEKPDKISPAMREKRGCFVTLHKKGALRGCIGTIEPVKSLIACVQENAVSSAFRDPRFPLLSSKELPDIDIEISVLTVPRPLKYKDSDDLIKRLKPGIHGVILSKGWHRSTFLPQVWEQIPDTERFLEHLCQKGRLERTCWKDKETMIEVYEVEYFSE